MQKIGYALKRLFYIEVSAAGLIVLSPPLPGIAFYRRIAGGNVRCRAFV